MHAFVGGVVRQILVVGGQFRPNPELTSRPDAVTVAMVARLDTVEVDDSAAAAASALCCAKADEAGTSSIADAQISDMNLARPRRLIFMG